MSPDERRIGSFWYVRSAMSQQVERNFSNSRHLALLCTLPFKIEKVQAIAIGVHHLKKTVVMSIYDTGHSRMWGVERSKSIIISKVVTLLGK